jgi:hypothetical protein
VVFLSGSDPDVKIIFLGFSSIIESKTSFGDKHYNKYSLWVL